jgi:hypothetical protein
VIATTTMVVVECRAVAPYGHRHYLDHVGGFANATAARYENTVRGLNANVLCVLCVPCVPQCECSTIGHSTLRTRGMVQLRTKICEPMDCNANKWSAMHLMFCAATVHSMVNTPSLFDISRILQSTMMFPTLTKLFISFSLLSPMQVDSHVLSPDKAFAVGGMGRFLQAESNATCYNEKNTSHEILP